MEYNLTYFLIYVQLIFPVSVPIQYSVLTSEARSLVSIQAEYTIHRLINQASYVSFSGKSLDKPGKVSMIDRSKLSHAVKIVENRDWQWGY